MYDIKLNDIYGMKDCIFTWEITHPDSDSRDWLFPCRSCNSLKCSLRSRCWHNQLSNRGQECPVLRETYMFRRSSTKTDLCISDASTKRTRPTIRCIRANTCRNTYATPKVSLTRSKPWQSVSGSWHRITYVHDCAARPMLLHRCILVYYAGLNDTLRLRVSLSEVLSLLTDQLQRG